MKLIVLKGKPPRHELRDAVVRRAQLAPELRISFRSVASGNGVSESEALDLLLEERNLHGQEQFEAGLKEGLRRARFGLLARAGRAA